MTTHINWRKNTELDNPWDADIIKPPFNPIYVRHTKKHFQGIQNPLNRLANNNSLLLKTSIEASPVWFKPYILQQLVKNPSPLLGKALYHNLLYRAKQLAYLQPIFELFLDPPCKGLVYISTIGKHFWVIGTTDAHAKANFNSNQKTFRLAFEGYLQLKNPKFILPKFKVIQYRFSFPSINKPKLTQIPQPLSADAADAMAKIKAELATKFIASPKNTSPLHKPFLFGNFPKAKLIKNQNMHNYDNNLDDNHQDNHQDNHKNLDKYQQAALDEIRILIGSEKKS